MDFYLIGIKGVGMASLCQFLKKQGHNVKGCDIKDYCYTEEYLKDIIIEDINDYKINDEIIIVSSAYEELYEKHKGINCFYYHQYVAKIHMKENIAVAGTHGKTTVTALTKHLIPDINYLIGDGTSGIGKRDVFLYEACEYKDHFLEYTPTILGITNIEKDHMDYFKDINQIVQSFQKLVNKSIVTIANGDDQNIRKLKGNILFYGFHNDNDIVLEKTSKGLFIDYYKEEFIFPFYGKYMAYNAALAIIIAKMMRVKKITFESFIFPHRRRNITHYQNKIIVDDYAHHPTEIKETLDSIHEEFPDNKVTVFFQPHTANRLIELHEEFIEILKKIDYLYIDEIFSSPREKEKVSIDFILADLPQAKHYNDFIKKPQDSDIYVFLGAGDLYKKIDTIKKTIR